MKISLEKLYQKAAERPPGYLEEVLAAGIIKDDFLEITWPAYQRLAAKYSPTLDSQPSTRLRGAGDLVALIAQPIARAIDRLAGTNLKGCAEKPDSPCAKRRAKLNTAIPFKSAKNPANLPPD